LVFLAEPSPLPFRFGSAFGFDLDFRRLVLEVVVDDPSLPGLFGPVVRMGRALLRATNRRRLMPVPARHQHGKELEWTPGRRQLGQIAGRHKPISQVAGTPEDRLGVETERGIAQALHLAVDRELVIEADPRHQAGVPFRSHVDGLALPGGFGLRGVLGRLEALSRLELGNYHDGGAKVAVHAVGVVGEDLGRGLGDSDGRCDVRHAV
jgi:hypothetical protein